MKIELSENGNKSYYTIKTGTYLILLTTICCIVSRLINLNWMPHSTPYSLSDSWSVFLLVEGYKNLTKEVGGHSFSTYAKFSEKLTFLTPVCVSGGKKCQFFVCTK